MSKRRLVITAVLSGKSQSEVARRYGVSQGWISRLMARYRAEGEAVFEARSRRPNSNPNATPPEVVNLVIDIRHRLGRAGLDAGAETIAWHLDHTHHTTVSRPTINRILTRAHLVAPEPRKRPKSSYIRFEADQPNECWQSDFTHYRLTRLDGTPGADVEIIAWLDDHSRFLLHASAHRPVTARVVHTTFRQAADLHGYPASTLTDNGMVYTVRLGAWVGSGNAGPESNGLSKGLTSAIWWAGAVRGCGGILRVPVRRGEKTAGALETVRLPPQVPAGAASRALVRMVNSFMRLWQPASRFHSSCAWPSPRRSTCFPCRVWICPNTGSTIALRLA